MALLSINTLPKTSKFAFGVKLPIPIDEGLIIEFPNIISPPVVRLLLRVIFPEVTFRSPPLIFTLPVL